MASKVNLTMDQGSVFTVSFDLVDGQGQPFDLTGYVGKSQMRKHYESSSFYEFDTTANSSGTIVLSMSAEETANVEAGRYMYDVEVSSGSTTYRVAEGLITVTSNITR